MENKSTNLEQTPPFCKTNVSGCFYKLNMKNREKLVRQLFVGKVSEILGLDKTLELLKEANEAFPKCEHNEDKDPKHTQMKSL